MIIYGLNPIKEILFHNPGLVREIYLLKSASEDKFKEIIETSTKLKLKLIFTDRKELDRLSRNSNHQGIVASIKEFEYTDIDTLIKDEKEGIFIVLDHIEDPHNLGTIIRTANFFGACGLIIPKDRASAVTPAVIKTSSGGAASLPISRVSNIGNAINKLKKNNIWIVGGDTYGDGNLNDLDLKGLNIALVIGSEGKGIKKSIKQKCDFLVSIPGAGKVGSLNASVAAGILIYEIKRKLAV